MSGPRTHLKHGIRAVIGRERWAWIARKLDKHPPPLSDSELATALKRAQRLLDAGKVSEARAILDGAWRPHRIRPPRRRQMAVLYQKAGALPEALRNWRALLRKLPKNAMALRRIRELEAGIVLENATADLDRGNHASARRALETYLAKHPAHSAANRLLMTTHIRSGKPGLAEQLAARATETGKANHAPMANLAIAYETAGRIDEAARTWADLAARSDSSLNLRIGRIHKVVSQQAAKTPKTTLAAKPAPDSATELDEAYRLGDERRLHRLLDRCDDPALREIFEIKQIYRTSSCADAFERADRFLKNHPPSHLAARQPELRELQWRALARLGEYQRAEDLLKLLDLDPLDRSLAELDVWWRADPARGLAITSRLWCGPGDPSRTSLLFCALPLILHDVETAAKHLGMDLARREHLRIPLPGDHLLCAYDLERRRRNHAEAESLLSRFFNRQKLETPHGLPRGFDHLSLHLPSYHGGPLVTVIMTSHNAGRTLPLALGSILAQTHARLEVIVVDDASSDDTLHLLLAAAARDPRVTIYQNQSNAGTYLSKNFALRRARGEFITFMDSDDWAHPRRIERHLAHMRGRPGLIACTSDWIRMTDEGRPHLRPWPAQFTHMNPGSLFIRRNVLEEIGYFDHVRIDADLEYLLRLRGQYSPEAISRVPATLTIGRFRDDSLTRAGVGAQDVELYSQTRADYRMDTLRWRRERYAQGETLFLDPASHPRPLPAALPIHAGCVPQVTEFQDRALPQVAAVD